jgi:aminoglycoside 3-N-acetyltransferase
MNNRKIVLKKNLIDGFKKVGIIDGDTVIVHTSIKSLGYVCGGPQVIIEALLETVGIKGTIIMPTQSWRNLDPSTGVHFDAEEKWWPLIRENWPPYDKEITPTNTMGCVAEMFRNYPGSFRSNHPARSFAANGKNAEYIVKNHDLSDIFGDSSPLAKLYELNAKVLLIGVDYDKNTSIHLADARANYKSKHSVKESSAISVNGKREWITYDSLFVDGEDFCEIGKSFEKNCYINSEMIGNSLVKLMNQRELVDFAVNWIEQNRE